MIVSKGVERTSLTSALIGLTKAIVSRFVGSSEPCLDDKQFRSIAMNPNRSVPKNEILETGRQVPAPVVPPCC